MTFTSQAQALASNGDTIGLERLLGSAAQARVEHRPDMPRTSEFLRAERLLDQLKRKGDAACYRSLIQTPAMQPAWKRPMD